MLNIKKFVVYDPIYGHIALTPLEEEIIASPFYQRLRWIKQLGLSFYLFHGAEHSRFGHSIGALFNSHKILESVGLAKSYEELSDVKYQDKDVVFNRELRIAALLHDLGTFPFSHTTESSYIEIGKKIKSNSNRTSPDNHEHLGSFIIKNTDTPGGITHALKKYGIDPQSISDLVKGVGPSILGNQILHAEIDCDRMDYLLRDAMYTGLKYGSYDRDYLLYHFLIEEIDGHRILAIKSNALHCVEDFLMSRFNWYSQVIRSSRGAKYDVLAESICSFLLESGLLYSFQELLGLVKEGPTHFYQFNDNYFMQVLYQWFHSDKSAKNPRMKNMADTFLFQRKVHTVKVEEFRPRLIDQDNHGELNKLNKKAIEKSQEIVNLVNKSGNDKMWVLVDIPKKDISFMSSRAKIVKKSGRNNVLLERDPVKISYEDGGVGLLADIENSVVSRMQNTINYIPNMYCNSETYEFLKSKNVIR